MTRQWRESGQGAGGGGHWPRLGGGLAECLCVRGLCVSVWACAGFPGSGLAVQSVGKGMRKLL